jgi:type IV pilus assembly protein PilP
MRYGVALFFVPFLIGASGDASYSPIGKRDPFRSIIRVEEPEGKLPLQKWSLEQLKLVAVVTGGPAPYAMVEDPDGLGHVVRRGNLIGDRWGRVTRIHARAIVVTERGYDFKGRRVESSTRLVIPRLPRPKSL